MTISRRLLLLLLPALALLMFGGGVIDYLMAVSITRNSYDQALASSALALGSQLQTVNGRLLFSPPSGARYDPRWYAIIGPDGTILGGDLALTGMAYPSANASSFNAFEGGQPLRVSRVEAPTPQGRATVYFAEPSERHRRAERTMLYGKLTVGFVQLDLALLLSWLAVHFGLRPLQSLRDKVESRTTRELQAFDEKEVPGEVRPLVSAFNRLLELLHDAAESQRRFVANAAHQLRTPIAGLSAQLELLRINPNAGALATELDTVNRGIARVAHSANQLLSLARSEQSSAQTEPFGPVPLRPMLEELIGRSIDRAVRHGLDLGADLQDTVIHGDAWMLQDLSSNLLDNALKYTPDGGRVTVRCGCDPHGAPFIEVEDDGPGIPEKERHSVRERFYRRTGTTAAGCGLGLAIVDEIARVHLAHFTINDGAGNAGTRMHVRFSKGLACDPSHKSTGPAFSEARRQTRASNLV